VTHYDLPNLFAGKLHAVLTRKRFIGSDNRRTIKGRDFYDLVWFLKKRVSPNLAKLRDQLGKELPREMLEKELDAIVELVTSQYLQDLETDLFPFISNHDGIIAFVKNFKEEYARNKKYLFEDTLQLFVLCKKCQKEFSAGITITKQVFEKFSIENNVHQCPFCGFENRLEKKGYLVK
jgi:hypothetical protein